MSAEPMTQAEWEANHPACGHCGVHHGDLAARLVEQLGPGFCEKLATAKAHAEREKGLAGLGWFGRLRARLGWSR